ncbi:hypothetical protein P7H71_00790 [Lactococcus lactis]|nr:hypothetical protein [Lactococcus lactis]MDT2872985.1 hypothetical protein [Lactococcus lactis]MDT2899081.1 hypothetical protein [Lactococcus lactis]MDT2915500.1 hypothetical protein [Lactococcus lactis]MDT2929118.1 hypothetical protein [Lactococcus lactis]
MLTFVLTIVFDLRFVLSMMAFGTLTSVVVLTFVPLAFLAV